MKWILQILLILGAFFVHNLVYAEEAVPSREISIYTPLEGLSQSVITALVQDPDGFIWIGTEDGLNRFDGIEFKIYRHDPDDSLSLPDNYISALKIDHEGKLWIGTANGLSCYQKGTGDFSNYYFDDPVFGVTGLKFILDMLPDEGNKLWVATRNSLDLLDTRNGKITQIRRGKDVFGIQSNPQSRVQLLKSGSQLWFHTNNSFKYIVLGGKDSSEVQLSSFELPLKPGREIKSSIIDRNGNIWASTGIEIFQFKPHLGAEIKIYPNDYLASTGSGSSLIFEDKSGRIWLSTDYGFFIKDQGKFIPHRGLNSYISKVGRGVPVTAIIEDGSEIFWLGTWHGMVKLDLKPGNFKLYSDNVNLPLELNIKNVSAFQIDYKGNLWVGTLGNGLFQFSPDRRKIKKFSTTSSSEITMISNDHILSIFEDSDKKLWIGTQTGVIYLNPSLSRFEDLDISSDSGESKLLLNLAVHQVGQDHNGNMLFGTNQGLVSTELEFLNDNATEKSGIDFQQLTENRVYSFHIDKMNRYWVGSQTGIELIDPATQKRKKIHRVNHGKIQNRPVLFIQSDQLENLWIGTQEGLGYIDTLSESIKMISDDFDFPEVNIFAITDDSYGNLWMSSSAGVIKFSPELSDYRIYNKYDGLQGNEFAQNAWFKSDMGEIFFGGYNGFNSFFPDDIETNPYPPQIAITDFQYLSSTGWKDMPVSGEALNLRTGRSNSIFIKYSILEFTNPSNNLSEYKLEGFDSEWKKGSNPGNVIYSNLKRGPYTFKIRGSNNDEYWSDKEVSLDIKVSTPIQSTKLAYLLYIVGVISTVYLGIRYWTHNLRKANQVLKEKEVAAKKIARQREELAVKNKNITDSIRYAQKIQEAMLPSAYFFKRLFPESFVILKPKDIVSGDFYWVTEKAGKVFVVSADCTGHGVPGALMSIVGFEILDKIINDQEVFEPAEILNILNKGVEATFSRSDDDMTVKDGMDLGLCMIDKTEKRLEFAGAFSSLYLIRDNKLTEIKGDRYSIGLNANESGDPFTNHFLEVEEEDRIYLFTDGYADQFGGPKGKKFMYRRFRHLLLTVHKVPMLEQKRFLEETLDVWMGDLEQVDDIQIVGIQPLK